LKRKQNNFQPFNYILLKLSARCNLDCTYCYWFRDDTVYSKPKVLTKEAENAFYVKLTNHIEKYRLRKFYVLFHGGEPLLIGKQRLFDLCTNLVEIGNNTGCKISLSITTNGVLIDDEFASILKHFDVSVTISIDGTKEVNDKNRIYHNKKGSYDDIISSIKKLKNFDVDLGILSVCNPDFSPELLYNHFVFDLKFKHFDVLMPDVTFEDSHIPKIAEYYKNLFDLWYGDGVTKPSDIRVMNSFILGLLGYNTTSEGLGYGPIQTLTMLTDGKLEPLDVLRISSNGSTNTTIDIFNNEIQDVTNDETWLNAYYASLNLNKKCNTCEFKNACGGGYLPHRYSLKNGYDNPSVYCDDLIEIYTYIWSKIKSSIYFENMTNQSIIAEFK
jgi:uncharacterized protein